MTCLPECEYLSPKLRKLLHYPARIERRSWRRHRPEQTGTTLAQAAGMFVLTPARRHRVVSRSRTELGNTTPTVQHGGPRDRLQGQNIGRDDGEKPPQVLA